MRAWASSTLGGPGLRRNVPRALLALALLGGLLWFIPIRRGGDHGAHQAPPKLDPFERAGVVELKEGQRGPQFSLERLTGGRASLDTWKGRLIVLNFWATWCTPCTLEMPTLEALWRDYSGRGLVVIGVSVDRGGPRALIEPYLRNAGLTFPILLDPDMTTASAWRVTGLPATFLIAPGGDVVGIAVGPREWNSPEMQALLVPLLPGAHRGEGA